MSNNKIKVAGYAQKVFFNDGIEYRNFSPDLVGTQLASDNSTLLFTMGNFSITTNMEPKLDKTYVTAPFSNFITLSDLKLSVSQTQTLLADNANVILNLDKSNLNYYALFGSLSEFVRVSLEDIITKWPASIYLTPLAQDTNGQPLNGFTFENYNYDPLSQIASFKINTTFIKNNYQLNYLKNGSIVNTFNATNDLRNLTVNYSAYAVLFDDVEYPVLGFTGSTYLTNDFVYFTIMGNPFTGTSTNGKQFYHIKPNKIYEEQFFNTLPDFEAYLLNRLITPKYTSVFNYPIKSDDGIILYVTDSITWPVTDGYNIDFDTTDYVNYASKLLDISTDNDLYVSNLMNRFLVSESISDFDTTPVHLSEQDQDTSGQKVNKTLQIYGREYDEINKYIVGIEFANVVTYNHLDNTPDIYLKNLARVLGWELISSVVENDLLANYVTTAPSTYSGQSVGLTAVEADIELWRRIILNTPWIWKSKGARKSVEFLLRFIGAPQGLVKFNEYIYRADAPIDVNLFKQALILNGLDPDLTLYPIDDDGYPNPLPNTPDMYFQNNGLWYRETGGSGSTIDILVGNNPHLGPYDGGFKYINQFTQLIPNFSAVTISSQTISQGITNLFTNYNLGVITNYTGSTYVDGMYEDGSSLGDCVVLTTTIIPDPIPSDFINDCGCSSASDDESLSVCIDIKEKINSGCTATMSGSPTQDTQNGVYIFPYLQYNQDGSVFMSNGQPVLNNSPYINPTCCVAIGGTPFLYNDIQNGNIVNTGYLCCYGDGNCSCKVPCDWTVSLIPVFLPLTGSSQDSYLVFSDGASQRVVSPDGCNCYGNPYTISVPNVLDPYTGEIGTACQLTNSGILNLVVFGTSGSLYQTYLQRSNGSISCTDVILPN